MKKSIFLLFVPLVLACHTDDGSVSSEEVTLFVDHYKTTSILNGTALVVQENEAIGTSGYQKLGRIAGFNFEPGFTYTLSALKTITRNPGTSTSTAAYELVAVNSMEKVRPDAKFRVPLSTFVNGQGYVPFLRRRQDSTFVISNEIPIECGHLCPSLHAAFISQQLMTGTFMHRAEGGYVMTELD